MEWGMGIGLSGTLRQQSEGLKILVHLLELGLRDPC